MLFYDNHTLPLRLGLPFFSVVATIQRNDMTQKLAKVAADVGLPNTTYFSTVFKRYIGRTPTDYRLNPWAKGVKELIDTALLIQ